MRYEFSVCDTCNIDEFEDEERCNNCIDSGDNIGWECDKDFRCELCKHYKAYPPFCEKCEFNEYFEEKKL